jgi:hypothetical protein
VIKARTPEDELIIKAAASVPDRDQLKVVPASTSVAV